MRDKLQDPTGNVYDPAAPAQPGTTSLESLAKTLARLGSIPDRQTALAQRIRFGREDAQTPMPGGYRVGETFIAASPLEHLAAALQRGKGVAAQRRSAAEFDQTTKDREQGLSAAAAALDAGSSPTSQDRMAALLQLSGDKALAPLGQHLMATGQQRAQMDQTRQLHQEDLSQRLTEMSLGEDFRRTQLAQAAQVEAARQAQQQAALEQQARLQGAELGLKRQGLDQDAWAFGQDPTGGGVMYNRKTGQVIPISPQGGGARPGQGTGLKPQQFEADVQALGKDVEPIAKALPDIETLKSATAGDDVAGFGPVAGRVPNLLTSGAGVGNRQAAGRLMAAIIQATSGQAASEKEVDRLLEANGMGRTATTDQLRQGVQKLESQYNALLKQREAKYLPEVVDTYGERGGYTSRTTGGRPAEPSTGGAVQVTSKAERDALPVGTRYTRPGDSTVYTKR